MTEKMTESLAIVPRSFTEITSMAETLSKSSLLPKALVGKMPEVAMMIQTGLELGLAPTTALRTIHIIEGKPVLSADLMVGLVLSRGVAEYFKLVEETATSVTWETKRVGQDPQRFTWSHEDTKTAALNNKDNWRLYPRQMRRARCKAILARDVYPDVLAGIYEEHEARELDVGGPAPKAYEREPDAVDADIVSETPVDGPSELIVAINAAVTVEALMKIAPAANKLTKGSAERDSVMKAFAARRKALEAEQAKPAEVNAEPVT